MGRTSFTREEIDELRRLIREKQTADRSRQKTLRARMRAIGFYIWTSPLTRPGSSSPTSTN